MISRRLDKLGRIVIPQEMRSKLNVTHNTLMDIDLQGDKIILSKSGRSCSVCGDTGDLIDDMPVCKKCAALIAAKLNAEG